jgi:hypothetical protein
MRDGVEFLFQQLPWAKPVLAWLVISIAILILAAVPSYLVFWPLARTLHDQLGKLASWLTIRHAQQSADRRRAINEATELYATDHLLIHLVTTGRSVWGRLSSEAALAAQQVKKAIDDAQKSLHDLVAAVPTIQEKLLSLETFFPSELPVVGDTQGLKTDMFKLRVARMQFGVAFFLVVALVVVNTGMLSQILGGLISGSLAVLGIPLFYILAVLITIAESGLGFAHGVFADAESASGAPKISLAAIILVVFGVGIAVVEGFFYSRIHQNRTDTVTIPFVNYNLAQTDIYFIWGFLLVMTLFVLGLITYRARVKTLYQTSAERVRKELERLTMDVQRWSDVVRSAGDLAARAQEQAKGEKLTAIYSSGAEAVQKLIQEMSGLQDPEWTKNTAVKLGAGDMSSLGLQAAVWTIFALLAAAIVTSCSVIALVEFGAVPSLPFALLIAGAEAVLLAIAGFLFSNAEIIVDANRNTKIVAPIWSRILGGGLLGVIEATNLIILFAVAIRMRAGFVWASNILAGLGLFAAAYQLSPLLGLAALKVRILVALALELLATVVRCCVRFVEAIAALAEQLFASLASPVEHIFRRRSHVTTG